MRLNDSTEVCLLFPFVDWQIDNGFFNRPTIAGTPILVHRWGPRIRISALFRFFCEAGYRPREIDILSLIYLKCPEYYGILCNSGTVHAVIPRAVVLFCSSGRASRGQRKSYIRDGARVSREPGSRVLLWFKRKIKDCLQPNVVVDSRGRARARARKLRAQSKKPRYFEGSRAKIPSSKMIGGPYVLKTFTLSWQRSIVRLLMI